MLPDGVIVFGSFTAVNVEDKLIGSFLSAIHSDDASRCVVGCFLVLQFVHRFICTQTHTQRKMKQKQKFRVN